MRLISPRARGSTSNTDSRRAELQETYRMILNHSVPSPRRLVRRDAASATSLAPCWRHGCPVLGLLSGRRRRPTRRRRLASVGRFGCPAQYAGSLARVGKWISVTHEWPAVRRVACSTLTISRPGPRPARACRRSCERADSRARCC
jgi:hypothetical protein